MVKRCSITNKKPLVGNNVSHAVNKTKRRFYPNLQNVSFFSEVLNKKIKLKVSSKAIKSVEKNGGIDSFILNLKNKDHTKETLKIKKLFSTRDNK
ncbi:MAG: 50S ribosomal protein L28 [Rickettsiales bacterium]|nr:50S ribosomal protein L28 [Rickettsiales bacterium]MBC33757.1 50S ribosomal protein L28 [Rickettsiales bacterium]|tara:strand:- start:1220 stop:1504 length:285 start_codon:yes stop_codon:yes gene_type:complete